MARFRSKKKKPFVKPIIKKQPSVAHITGDKIPKSFVFSRGKLPGSLRQLQMDLRKLMLPFTALKLKVSIAWEFHSKFQEDIDEYIYKIARIST